MQTFRFVADGGLYLLREGIEDRITENTEYVIFADDKATAASLAARFVAEKVGSSSPRISHAEFHEIGKLIESWDPNQKYESLFETTKRLKLCIGSITLDGVIVVSPYSEDDTLIVTVSEGEKLRVLSEPLCILEDERRVEWGSDSSPFEVQSLARAIQALF